MNEKKARCLRQEAKRTYGVPELLAKYEQGPGPVQTLRLVGVKAIYKQAKRNANRRALCQ